jgi:tetratricopeptide (TPR) repeat protein
MLRRVVAYFDPAVAGFGRRMWRLARWGLLAVAAALLALGVFLLRLPQARYWWGVTQLEAGFPAAAARTAQGAIDEGLATHYGFYRLLAAGQRRTGRIAEQLATFDEAVRRFPDFWFAQGHRCWYGSLFGDARRVLDSCDRAVDLAPKSRGEPLAWRGVARALSGDRAGAIADLEAAMARWDGGSQWGSPYVKRRREWLRQLKAGKDPFDEATLDRERRSF